MKTTNRCLDIEFEKTERVIENESTSETPTVGDPTLYLSDVPFLDIFRRSVVGRSLVPESGCRTLLNLERLLVYLFELSVTGGG